MTLQPGRWGRGVHSTLLHVCRGGGGEGGRHSSCCSRHVSYDIWTVRFCIANVSFLLSSFSLRDLFIFFQGRGPNAQVKLPEDDIRSLCLVARDVFLNQPCLLQLATPMKICGEIPIATPRQEEHDIYHTDTAVDTSRFNYLPCVKMIFTPCLVYALGYEVDSGVLTYDTYNTSSRCPGVPTHSPSLRQQHGCLQMFIVRVYL